MQALAGNDKPDTRWISSSTSTKTQFKTTVELQIDTQAIFFIHSLYMSFCRRIPFSHLLAKSVGPNNLGSDNLKLLVLELL